MNEQVKTCKLIVAGDGGVGKTTLIYRLIGKEKDIEITKGLDFENQLIDLGNNIKSDIIFWDLGGQPKFRFFQSDFFDSANIILFIFDLNRYTSFLNIEKEWVPLVKERKLSNSSIQILIGNKADVEQTIDDTKIQEFVEKMNIPFVKISAKNSTNLNKLKDLIIDSVKVWFNDN